ncbi:MAG: hypothetical protein LUC90_09255 [Lachnospiraceae bacterium]|nr:hypothetical protein [Lachnospiraceae bacterium]
MDAFVKTTFFLSITRIVKWEHKLMSFKKLKIIVSLKDGLTKIRNWICVKMFPQRNKILAMLTLVLAFAILLIIKYCDAPLLLPEKYFSFLLYDANGDKTLYNIAISYLAAYIFYLLQVHLPSRQKEKRAYKLIRKQLSELIIDIKELIYIFHEMYDVDENGTLSLNQDQVLFFEEYWDAYKSSHDIVKPNPERVNNGKYKRGGCYSCKGEKAFCEKTEKVKKKYERLMENRQLQNCDENLVDMLEEFKAGQLCSNMKGAVLMRQISDTVNNAVHTAYVVTPAADELNDILKIMPGMSVTPHQDHLKVSQNGNEIGKIDLKKKKDVDGISEVSHDIQAVEQQMSRIEYYCDVDGEVSFRKYTDKEMQRNKYSEIFVKELQKHFEGVK